MQDSWQPVTHRPGLEAIAELLLWAGWDRLADEIYAAIEASADDTTAETDPEWTEAFR